LREAAREGAYTRPASLDTPMQHALRTLLMPASVALVGASARPGSIGRVVLENLERGGFRGTIHAVNPSRRAVLGIDAVPSLRSIGSPVDLAIVATPPAAVAAVLDDAAAAKVGNVLIITAPPGDAAEAARWLDDVASRARTSGVRVVGPGAFGVVRTGIGLDATYAAVAATPGRLALVSQSGAVVTAMLDFAAPIGIGFSTVIAVGSEVDVEIGELLDALGGDAETDGILLYVETIARARPFLSALRAAARAKPVVVLKAGRSQSDAVDDATPDEDDVVGAALHRAGTVRVGTYTQLFAAARALAMGRIPRGERIAIVANGRGAAMLAADRASDLGLPLASLGAATLAALDKLLPGESTRANPVDVRGHATAAHFAGALEAVLGDAGVDAAIALAVPRPIDSPMTMARAAAEVARTSRKPVLGAWLGSIDRHDERAALEAGGIADFYTPENAVEALSYLVAYRRNQEWLLEAPASRPVDEAPDLARAARVRERAITCGATTLPPDDAIELLAAFGIAHAPAMAAASVDEARAAARRLRYPVMLATDAPRAQRVLATGAPALAREFATLAAAGAATVRVMAVPRVAGARPFAIRVHVDAVFGPVITMGAATYFAKTRGSTMLPPLSPRLAADLVDACGVPARELDAPSRAALARMALAVSAIVAALPWVRRMRLEPIAVGAGEAVVADARIDVDPRRASVAHYAHMAIHPYPLELEGEIALGGTRFFVRPMRPEDVELERAFVAGLSDNTRYLRFFYQLHELTPQMLARFTQVDYDRELALVAMPRDRDGHVEPAFAAVARYIRAPDGDVAEFAIVVGDAWQARGLGHAMMERLVAAARGNGVRRLEGAVLRANASMLRFVGTLGFAVREDPDDREQVIVSRDLAASP
jgi:acetyltransferase